MLGAADTATLAALLTAAGWVEKAVPKKHCGLQRGLGLGLHSDAGSPSSLPVWPQIKEPISESVFSSVKY